MAVVLESYDWLSSSIQDLEAAWWSPCPFNLCRCFLHNATVPEIIAPSQNSEIYRVSNRKSSACDSNTISSIHSVRNLNVYMKTNA